jgi:DNA-binding response OmpR family regulator
MIAPASCASVLVVEDDPDLRESVVLFLRDEGFQVYEAEDGEKALFALPTVARPVLVLADLMTSKIDGPLLLGALAKDDRLATLPVIVLSAEDPMSPQGYRRLKKPIDRSDLLQIVGELCARRT